MRFSFLLFLSVLICSSALAQTAISGKVTDPTTGEELINATIQLFKNGVFIQGTVTDFNGDYKIKVDPGTYDVLCSFLGSTDKRIVGVIIKEGQTTQLGIQLEEDIHFDELIIINCVNIPMISNEPVTEQVSIDHYEIRRRPNRGVKQIATMTAGLSFQ